MLEEEIYIIEISNHFQIRNDVLNAEEVDRP